MASYTTVTRARVRLATNTPGGPVREAVRKTTRMAKKLAVGRAPVGNAGDYLHRIWFPAWATGPKAPGTFKASFSTDIRGTAGSLVVGNLRNTADHADIVELGRKSRGGKQVFISAGSPPSLRGGSAFDDQKIIAQSLIQAYGTATRDGSHVMADSLSDAAQYVLGVRAGRAAMLAAASSSAVKKSALR